MSRMQRDKGARGEREVVNLLRERLGSQIVIERNINQARDGGYDVTCGPFAIEVKRGEKFQAAWIKQAVESCPRDMVPVLAWRRNGSAWVFMVLGDLEDFCLHVRETIGDENTGCT